MSCARVRVSVSVRIRYPYEKQKSLVKLYSMKSTKVRTLGAYTEYVYYGTPNPPKIDIDYVKR